jgi:hypothetical protein
MPKSFFFSFILNIRIRRRLPLRRTQEVISFLIPIQSDVSIGDNANRPANSVRFLTLDRSAYTAALLERSSYRAFLYCVPICCLSA